MKLIKLILLIICIAAILIFSACPNALEPFNPAVVSQVKDITAPVIEIISPDNNAVYGQIVTVEGRVADDGAISSLSWTVSGPLGALDEGEVSTDALAEDGSFSFEFPAASYSSTIMVNIEATDWNGNTAAESINLNYSGSAVPSFQAVPASKSVTLYWEEIPEAESYTVYYTTNGNLPSEAYTETPIVRSAPPTVASPLIINSLKNGETHIFLLKAVGADGKEWESKYLSVIPTSGSTFTPIVTGGNDSIKVEWDSKSTVSAFEVWRSESENGIYNNISGVIAESFFFDSMVEPGIMYYYKVKPAGGDAVLSGSASTMIYPYTISEITELFSCEGSGSAEDIDAVDNYVYVAAGSAGIQVYNLIPNNMNYGRLQWEVGTAGSAVGIDVEGELAYTAEGVDGVEIFALTSSGKRVSPIQFTHFNPVHFPPAYAWDVEINPDNNYCLLIADGGNGFRLLDTSDIFSPSYFSSTIVSSGMVMEMTSETDFSYIVTVPVDQPVIKKIDISNPAAPHSEVVSYSYSESSDPPFELEVYGSFLYAGGTGYLYIFNKNTGMESAKIKTAGVVEDIEFNNNRMYVLEGDNSIRVVDVLNPANPVTLEFKTFESSFKCIKYYNSKLLLGRADGGVTVLGSASLGSPVVESSILTTAWAIDVSGNDLYIADKGIRGFRLEDGEVTGETYYYNVEGGSVIGKIFKDLDTQNGFVYAVSSNYLKIWNKANPDDFTSCTLPDTANGVVVRGDYAYVGNSFQGLQVVDISNPDAPVIAGFCNTTGQAGNLVISGNLICLDDGTEGVAVIDVSDPTSPVLKGRCITTSDVNDVAMLGDYLAASITGGLEIFDISNSVSPVKIGGLSGGALRGGEIETAGDNIYIEDVDTNNLNIILASDPSRPYVVKTISCEGLDGLAVSGSKLYLLDNEKLKTVDISL